MTARILVATDLSDAAEEAVRQADAYARAVGGSFAVCTVVPPLHTVHMFFPQLYQSEATEIGGLTREVDDAVRKGVERLTSRKRDQFELFIDYGTDYAEIVRRAETWGATRLFVGAQGRTGLARLLLGSVAEKGPFSRPPIAPIRRCPRSRPRLKRRVRNAHVSVLCVRLARPD